MRKIVLALILTLAAVAVGVAQAAAMEGFDLGDMPPLPPPLLDDSPTPPPAVAAPGSGALSPLIQGESTSSAGLTPAVPPLGGAPLTPPAADAGGMDFASPLPPSPPPLTPPATPSLTPPASQAGMAVSLPGELGSTPLPPAAPATPAPAVPETPRPGRIEGGRVNVRAGPNTQYESIAVLSTGSPVTVLAKHDEWYKIIFPADQLASIHKNMVDADITGEIPETGLPGVVNQDNAPVHAFYWDKSTVVGSLNRGDPVTIKQERGQWYRIVPPASARAYVFAKYVRVDGGGAQVAMDSAPAPSNPSLDLTAGGDGKSSGPVKLSAEDEKVLTIKESYYKRLRERFDAEREAEEQALQAAIEAKKNQANQLDSALKDLDSRLSAIDQETSERINYMTRELYPSAAPVTTVGAASWAPPDPAGGGYTGWVENIGRVGGAPSPFRLTKGGEIRFYLVSNVHNLNEFTNRRVWLNGPIENVGSANANVLNVDQIRILTELEVAESMQQPAAAGYGDGGFVDTSVYGGVGTYTAQPVPADPYAGSYSAPMSSSDPFAGYGSDYYAVHQGGAAPAPSEPFAGYGADYGSAQTYQAPASPDPFAGYGSDYGTAQTYAAPPYGGGASGMGQGTADMVVGGGYGAPASSYAQPPAPQPFPAQGQGGIRPSDASQLPDIVGASTPQYLDSPSAPVGGGLNLGEIGTDSYERPNIVEIPPQTP